MAITQFLPTTNQPNSPLPPVSHLQIMLWRLYYLLPNLGHLGGFPSGSAGKESVCNAGDLSSILGLGSSPGERKGYSLQYSGLENSNDFIVHGILHPRTLEWVAMPPPQEFPNPGIKLGSPALQTDSLPAELPGKPR